MAARIPEDKIKEISRSVDIVDVVSEYVHLKKQGRNYFGLCPFHDEKTPSFSVSPEKQIFYCFGCGQGGNVFSFLMDIEGISFQEAAVKLANRANIPLQINYSHSRRRVPDQHEKMMEAHELLRQLYHHLLVNTNKGQEALQYLQKRNFSQEIIEEFQIGYSLDEWDSSLKFLKSKGFSEELLEKAGLVIKSETNESYYDRFRGRIMFPITDHKGNTVAFSGRVIDGGEPKYLNSPETPIFRKGQILFNFHRARPAIRKKRTVVIFEGFADCIAAYSAGIEHSICTMGTALTDEQIHTIKRNAERVILCFDSDLPGQKATLKAGEMLQNSGCLVQVAILPDAKDPDEYIRKKGKQSFINRVINESITFMAFKMKYYRRGKNLQNEADQILYIDQVLRELSKIDNAIERDVYIRQLAEEFSLSLDALKQQQRKIYYELKKNTRNKNGTEKEKRFSPVIINKQLPNRFVNAERMLIAHMLKSASFTERVRNTLKETPFSVDDHQAIVTYLYAYYEEGNEPDLNHFLNFINDRHLKQLVVEIGMIPAGNEVSDREFQDYIKHVMNQHILLKIKEKEKESKEAEREKNFKKAAEIANEIIKLKRSL